MWVSQGVCLEQDYVRKNILDCILNKIFRVHFLVPTPSFSILLVSFACVMIFCDGWIRAMYHIGDRSISAGPLKRVKYERTSRSSEIYSGGIKTRPMIVKSSLPSPPRIQLSFLVKPITPKTRLYLRLTQSLNVSC